MVETIEETLEFVDTSIGASSRVTLVSDRLRVPFIVKEIEVDFPDGADFQVTVKVFVAADESAPTANEPGGANILDGWGPSNYLVGNNGKVVHKCNYRGHPGDRLKVHAYNQTAESQVISARIKVEVPVYMKHMDLKTVFFPALAVGEGKINHRIQKIEILGDHQVVYIELYRLAVREIEPVPSVEKTIVGESVLTLPTKISPSEVADKVQDAVQSILANADQVERILALVEEKVTV